MEQTAFVTDWENEIRNYGKQNGFANYRSTLQWLVSRDSLQVIAELLGVKYLDDAKMLKNTLNSLGKFLDKRGWTVPPMYCPLNSYAYDAETRVGDKVAVNVALSNTSAGVRMQDYLKIRLDGASRTQANRKLGVNPGSFYQLLERWGLKDMKAETELLNRIKENPVILDEMSDINSTVSSKAVEASETPVEYKRTVALHLTLTEAVIRESINALVEIAPEPKISGNGQTVADSIMERLWYCRQANVDIATELVKRLREVAG